MEVKMKKERQVTIGVAMPESMHSHVLQASKRLGMKKSEYVRLAIIKQLSVDADTKLNAIYRQIVNGILTTINNGDQSENN